MAIKHQGSKTLVTVLSAKGASVLVEYLENDVLRRKYVPANTLNERYVADSVLECGIPYGYPWEEIQIDFNAQQFAIEMQNAGLWTVEDVLREPNKLTGVLRKIFETSIRTVLETARREKKRS